MKTKPETKKVRFIDGREELLKRLDRTRKEVESGEVIGCFFLTVMRDGNITPRWSANDIPNSGAIMRGALAFAAARFDEMALENYEELVDAEDE